MAREIHHHERSAITDHVVPHLPAESRLAWSQRDDVNGGQWISVHWTTPKGDFPTLAVGFYFEADGTMSGVRVEPFKLSADGPMAIGVQLTSRRLREIPFANLEHLARDIARKSAARRVELAGAEAVVMNAAGEVVERVALEHGGGPGSLKQRRAQAEFGALSSTKAKAAGGRPRLHDDTHLAFIADRYTSCLGLPDPIAEVARVESLSRSQVRNLVARARERGMLTHTPRGRAGGQLTPKAAQLMQEATDENRREIERRMAGKEDS
ncbi:MAG: hypothetical protein AB7R77_27885 [Ilumatobacteraceae bacterium]